MGQIKFHLKNPKATKETQIYLEFFYNYQRLKYYTTEYINPVAWNFKESKPIPGIKFPHNQEINRQLSKYEYFLIDLFTSLKRNKAEITPKVLRGYLDKEFRTADTPSSVDEAPKPTLLEYIETFISECEAGKRLNPDKYRLSKWTIKGYVTLLYHLKRYTKTNRKQVDFDDVTLAFYDDFLHYFITNNYAPNTIGKHIKNIKVMMKAALKDKLHNNCAFEEKEFKYISSESENIYLNNNDLFKIYKLDLSNNKRLEKVRDLFIIAAQTATRYAELANLNINNLFIENDTVFLKTYQQKTKKNCVVPLRKESIEIFLKYNGVLPRCPSNQNMNKYLKEIGQLAEINSIETRTITRGGVNITETFEKWEHIVTHTGRRSAATNLFNAGYIPLQIMQFTGHSTEKSFRKYISMDQNAHARKFAESELFRNNLEGVDLEEVKKMIKS